MQAVTGALTRVGEREGKLRIFLHLALPSPPGCWLPKSHLATKLIHGLVPGAPLNSSLVNNCSLQAPLIRFCG